MGETEFETGGDWSAEEQADLDGFLAETEGADADGTDWTADDEHEPAPPGYSADPVHLAAALLSPEEYTDDEVRQIEQADYEERVQGEARQLFAGMGVDSVLSEEVKTLGRREGLAITDEELPLVLHHFDTLSEAALQAGRAQGRSEAEMNAWLGENSVRLLTDVVTGLRDAKVGIRAMGGPASRETMDRLELLQTPIYNAAERERIGARAIAEAERRVGTANPGGEPGTRPVFGARRQ